MLEERHDAIFRRAFLRTPFGDVLIDFDALVPGDVFRMDEPDGTPVSGGAYSKVIQRTVDGALVVEPAP
jgi:hypothetical protein